MYSENRTRVGHFDEGTFKGYVNTAKPWRDAEGVLHDVKLYSVWSEEALAAVGLYRCKDIGMPEGPWSTVPTAKPVLTDGKMTLEWSGGVKDDAAIAERELLNSKAEIESGASEFLAGLGFTSEVIAENTAREQILSDTADKTPDDETEMESLLTIGKYIESVWTARDHALAAVATGEVTAVPDFPQPSPEVVAAVTAVKTLRAGA